MKLKITLILFSIFFIFSCSSSEQNYSSKTSVKPNRLANTSWKLKSLSGVDLEQVFSEAEVKKDLTLNFSSKEISGNSGVNTYFAEYSGIDSNISFSPIGISLMSGTPALMELESKFLEQLQNVNSYEIKGNILTLKADGKTLTFEKIR